MRKNLIENSFLLNKYYSNLLTYLFLIIFVTAPTHYTQVLNAEKIYEKVSDAVVVILTYDSNNQLLKQGSGVVINDKGYVVTNFHVLEDCDKLEVLHNNEIVPYEDVIGIDVEKDIVILKIEEKKLSSIKIGNSKKMNIGQKVYAIGSPLGFENSLSEGIISGLRSYEENHRDFIQITASISPGSSGGAVVNDKGELIGISTLTAKEGQNLNFAVPIEDVLAINIGSYSYNKSIKNFELFFKGNQATKSGNHRKAIDYYSNYLKLFPNDDVAYFNRGVAKAKLDDIRGAIKDYTKAIDINPNNLDAYINLGIAKSILKDYKGAIKEYSNALKIDPNDAGTYHNRGLAKAELKDGSGAIKDYNRAILIDPSYAMAYFNRGIEKYLLGDKSGACLDWSKAGELGNYAAYDMIREYCP